jgi:hypothetical protein
VFEGDFDNDGQVTVLDLVRAISLARNPGAFTSTELLAADVNDDGSVDDRDVDLMVSRVLGLPFPSTPRPVTFTPAAGAAEVGVTVRPRVDFPKAVNTAMLNSNNLYATQGGRRLPATIRPSDSGSFAWLFFTEPMPNAATIEVVVDGSSIRTIRGLLLDADGDGRAGGVARSRFSTVSVVPLDGTALVGRLVDPGPDLIRMTADDFHPGPDGRTNTTDDVFLLPVRGVKVFLLGMEAHAVFTDAGGWFRLEPVPAGIVKVETDGTTAPAPEGFYFPSMVMVSRRRRGRYIVSMPGIT